MLVSVVKHAGQRRFVNNERSHLLGMPGQQFESYQGTAAAAEYVRWLAAEYGEQLAGVVGEGLDRRVLGFTVEAAAG